MTILILDFWVTAVPVYSAGIVFDWQPFTAEIKVEKAKFSPDIFLKKSLISREMRDQFSDVYYLLPGDSITDNGFSKTTDQKTVLDRIKISISRVDSFMLAPDRTASQNKDVAFGDIVRTVPSFFKNPSTDTAVQTLKLFEPQVNLGFEF
jgi:hypothetical protein